MMRDELTQRLRECLLQTDLIIDSEFSNSNFIYARDRDGAKCPWNARVTIIISPNSCTADEYIVDVRSSEPMLKKGTRCERLANMVKITIAPKS